MTCRKNGKNTWPKHLIHWKMWKQVTES
jgi:hypothetical protein